MRLYNKNYLDLVIDHATSLGWSGDLLIAIGKEIEKRCKVKKPKPCEAGQSNWVPSDPRVLLYLVVWDMAEAGGCPKRWTQHFRRWWIGLGVFIEMTSALKRRTVICDPDRKDRVDWQQDDREWAFQGDPPEVEAWHGELSGHIARMGYEDETEPACQDSPLCGCHGIANEAVSDD